VTGKRIVTASWASLALFTAVAVPNALGLHALDTATTLVAVTMFGAAIVLWLYAFGLAVVRSGRGDDIVVSSWVFLTGSAPSDVRRQLLGAAAASTVVGIATAFANPFAVLVPMLHLGFAALWGARHGTFPPRQVPHAGRTARVAKGGRP
jgi:hypothetical protein